MDNIFKRIIAITLGLTLAIYVGSIIHYNSLKEEIRKSVSEFKDKDRKIDSLTTKLDYYEGQYNLNPAKLFKDSIK